MAKNPRATWPKGQMPPGLQRYREEQARLKAQVAAPEAQSEQGWVAPPPGEWTMGTILSHPEMGEMVDLEPTESTTIGFNGVTIWVTGGVINKVPRIFKQIYDESRRATREAFENSRRVMQKRPVDEVKILDGWVPEEEVGSA